MSKKRQMADGLENVVAGLGTDRDKASHSYYAPVYLTFEQLTHAYRGSWIPRKIVDIPPMDATRRWRAWKAPARQIEAIEGEEKRLNIQAKVKEAMTKARLFGGAAIFIGTKDIDLSVPLRPESIARGGIRYLNVMTRTHLVPTELDRDPQSERFNKPIAYRLANTDQEVHPSRLINFIGAPVPDPELVVGDSWGWGDSILQACMEAVKQADATLANVASLIFEAKIDVIKIPDLMANLANPQFEKEVLKRLGLAMRAKSINGTLILDAAEDYQSKSASFGSLAELIAQFLQVVSGAADIPASRMLGISPSGLNSSGAGDLRNYYDRIQSMQELEIGPEMRLFDEMLMRSALGRRPKSVHYQWNPLWQPTADEQSMMNERDAKTIKYVAESNLFAEDALAVAASNHFTEAGFLPGLAEAIAAAAAEGAEETAVL